MTTTAAGKMMHEEIIHIEEEGEHNHDNIGKNKSPEKVNKQRMIRKDSSIIK
jgi:hypothetical protein